MNEIKGIDKKIRGILGLNFLDSFNYLISYTSRTIEIEATGDTSWRISGPRIPVDRTEGKLIITVLTRFSGQAPLRFGLDSGVGAPVIYTPDSRHVCVQSWPGSPAGAASTLTGTASTVSARMVALDIGA